MPKMNSVVIFLLYLLFQLSNCQRVAPGVPPQQYQHPPPPAPTPMQQQYPQHVPINQQYHQQAVPQHQQVPVQHQQMPPQQQQMPPQHQQVHVPVQQPNPQMGHQGAHAGHGSNAHHGGGQILNAANIVNEREHIAEHMSVPIDTSKMSEQELQFHYFKMHDADNNNKLDGCELIKSLIHWHEQGHKDPLNTAPPPGEKIFKDDELVGLIDPIFSIDDANNDGYIDYPEFVQAQQKAAAKQ